MISRPLRFGMVGGGAGAFVGPIHRLAAEHGHRARLVAGAFSKDPQRSRATGADLGLDPERVYGTCEEMVVAESTRSAAERLDFVSIVTPTGEHARIAAMFLQAGFNVVCEKPLTCTLEDAEELRSIVHTTGQILAVTYNYRGNAMVHEARHLIQQGKLGKLRKVIVEYSQGWLAERLEHAAQKQALWRMDPELAGQAGCLSDIGVHAYDLLCYVTGLRAERVCADIGTCATGRQVPDDAAVLLRLTQEVRGTLHCSQVSVGEENNLNVRVYGTRASLEWRQEEPNHLTLKYATRPTEVLRRGNFYNAKVPGGSGVLPPGHPEGFLDAFACLYRQAIEAIAAQIEGTVDPDAPKYPGVDDGVEGMRFVDAAHRSAAAGGRWVDVRRTGGNGNGFQEDSG